MSKKSFIIQCILFCCIAALAPIIASLPTFFPSVDNSLIITLSGRHLFEFPKEYCFYGYVVVLIITILLWCISTWFKHVKPNIKLREAGDELLKLIMEIYLLEIFANRDEEIRVMIHRAKRTLWSFGLFSSLTPVYRWGFKRQHRDYHLKLYSCRKLGFYKGVCGLAFLKEKPQFANLSVSDPHDYNFSKADIDKTEDIKGIISIPIFEPPTPRRTPRTIGVISIDTKKKDTADLWESDQNRVEHIIENFEPVVRIVSLLV